LFSFLGPWSQSLCSAANNSKRKDNFQKMADLEGNDGMIHLRSKILLLVLFSVIATVLGAIFFTTKSFLQDKRNYITEMNSLASVHSARLLDEVLLGFRREFLHLDDLLKNPSHPSPDFSRRLMQIAGLELLHIYDIRGNLLLSAGRSQMTGVSEEILTAIKNLKPGQTTVLHTQSANSLPGTLLYLNQVNQRFYGAFLKDQVLTSSLGGSQALEISLVNQTGQILVRNHEASISNDPAVKTFIADFFHQHLDQSVWAQIITRTGGDKILVAMSGLQAIPGSAILVTVPDTESAVLATQAIRQALPFIVGVIIIIGLSGLVFSNRLTRSLENLTEAASQLSTGNWNVTLRERSRDEVGKLIAAFRKMARELRNREEALKTAHQKLIRSEKLATLGQFSAGIAHEIKNPLTSILTYSQLIERKTGTPEEFAKHISDETRRANRIITDLLVFARQKEPNRNPQNLVTLVERSLSLLIPQIQASQVMLEKKISEAEVQCPVDADQIHQVLSNLILNALQAMESLSPANRRLTVVLRKEPDWGFISIQDSGPGVAPENQGRIFEPFFSTKAIGKGTGLGLSMCHGIIQQHQGQISLHSEPGQGACFEVRLPFV